MLNKNSLLMFAFGLVIVFGTLHFFGSILYLYWTVWWFDLFMHFLGGVCLGVFMIWLVYSYRHSSYPLFSRRRAILTSLVSVIVIGIGWEVFEYVNDIADSTENYSLDVFTDLVADSLGAIVAGVIATSKRFKLNG